ncbi:hypothetical protein [Xanthomonas arboricola]|uniref:hypothetical protein n=1 Tax=Xanthomonas arboricola TaxID=56448 RepID=UPI00058494C3|nr:hypothetical protein [Xanthomonas arboricola]MDN0209787.1 hypothetical protein [Xanthomonas arboricola pv. corylina]MDN0214102.1 hypothetical protein [Xanthomonas arboricola pv. corylina]UQQ11861.1 hypothetical protein KP021_06500 [Xanthomonas arboricola pv. corylina]WIX24653.1 hypothetical protein PUV44_18845 [Xanthomonas arboricola pv. corylina]
MKKHNRQTLENRADRLGLQLSEAGRHARYEAASNNEPMPRWELSDGKHQDTIAGYSTLADVAEALDHKEIMAAL